ncbi:alpha/beta fold hydrolase, partial [Streptomyces sp. SID7803]|nr:alpha/beta fold hydrolase [Streptomyces sp. SID7803]
TVPAVTPGTHTSFGEIKQVKAGVLNVGYAEAGPPSHGPVVMLLHGWPYDIHSYVDVAPLLADLGYRVIVPYLRGHGSTTFLSRRTPAHGRAVRHRAGRHLPDGRLKIEKAALAGFDWGSRTADIIAALWPERVTSMVSTSGYLITDRKTQAAPADPAVERTWWYQWYFATPPGARRPWRARGAGSRCAVTCGPWSPPNWAFDDATYNRTAEAFRNPDYAAVVLFNYRWRIGLVDTDPPGTRATRSCSPPSPPSTCPRSPWT